MKLLIVLLFLLPFAVTAQTVSDYNHAMKKFQQFYNAGRGDSINAMFGHGWDDMKAEKPLWTNETTTKYLKEIGYLKSFTFIGIDTLDPEKVYVFKTMYSKAGAKMSSLTLDKDNGLGTFRFITTPDWIPVLPNNKTK